MAGLPLRGGALMGHAGAEHRKMFERNQLARPRHLDDKLASRHQAGAPIIQSIGRRRREPATRHAQETAGKKRSASRPGLPAPRHPPKVEGQNSQAFVKSTPQHGRPIEGKATIGVGGAPKKEAGSGLARARQNIMMGPSAGGIAEPRGLAQAREKITRDAGRHFCAPAGEMPKLHPTHAGAAAGNFHWPSATGQGSAGNSWAGQSRGRRFPGIGGLFPGLGQEEVDQTQPTPLKT